jgi:hypothetical protein
VRNPPFPTRSVLTTPLEGRWVVDDYYEDKVLADITEKGLKPGDLVGELADPNAPSAAALAAAELANAQKGDRTGGTQGIYRAGGPTTLFGSAGWGPYSDGPLNAVRKSLLNRDGLNEENWMLIAAQRTADAGAEWAKQRRGALVPYGGIFGATAPAPAEKKDEAGEGKAEGKRQAHGDEQDQGAQEQREADGAATDTRARKRARWEEKEPTGVYEPHIGIVLCQFFFFWFFYLLRIVVLTFILSCPHRSCGHTADVCALGRLERHGRKAPGAWGYQSREWRMGPCLGRHRYGTSSERAGPRCRSCCRGGTQTIIRARSNRHESIITCICSTLPNLIVLLLY